MRIANVYIQDLLGFKNLQLDFTYPEGHPKAGLPMEEICLIGGNETNKSALIGLLVDYLRNVMRFRSKALFLVKLHVLDKFVYGVYLNNTVLFFRDTIESSPDWMIELLRDQNFTMAFNHKYESHCIGFEEDAALFDQLWLDNNGQDLIFHQPADYGRDGSHRLVEMPPTKGHEADSLQQAFPLYSEISPERLTEFWSLLIYLVVRRAEAIAPVKEGRGRATAETPIPAAAYPEPLAELAKLWQPYLAQVGVELAVDQALLPGHYRDRLYLPFRRIQDKQKVDFGQLEVGVRRLILSVGYIWALQFMRETRSRFAFIEEPERHLHPRWQVHALDAYREALQGSQAFFQTNNPSIAARFAPANRIILHADKHGLIHSRSSSLPADASLEEILASDFA